MVLKCERITNPVWHPYFISISFFFLNPSSQHNFKSPLYTLNNQTGSQKICFVSNKRFFSFLLTGKILSLNWVVVYNLENVGQKKKKKLIYHHYFIASKGSLNIKNHMNTDSLKNKNNILHYFLSSLEIKRNKALMSTLLTITNTIKVQINFPFLFFIFFYFVIIYYYYFFNQDDKHLNI